MKVLHPPTPAQHHCRHRWKEIRSVVIHGKLMRQRYYRCETCDLRIRTLEQPNVSWWSVTQRRIEHSPTAKMKAHTS